MDLLIKADKQLLEEQRREQEDIEMNVPSIHSEDQERVYPPDESTMGLEPHTQVLTLERVRFSTLSTRGSFDPRFHVYVIIFDFTRCNDLDASALLVLEQVIHSYKSHHTRFIVTGLHPFHIKLFRKSGLMDKLGEENVFKTVRDAMNSISKFRF
jgi:MFS superfamily sulfate permease-like transporter